MRAVRVFGDCVGRSFASVTVILVGYRVPGSGMREERGVFGIMVTRDLF